MNAPPANADPGPRSGLRPWAGATSLVKDLLSPRVSGFVDREIADEVFGWAFDPRRPDRRVLVTARLDGKVIGETLADLLRRDLQNAGKGDGRCGFRLKLRTSLTQDERSRVVIEARAGLHRRRLKYARRFKPQAPIQDASSPLDAPRGPSAGFMERCTGGVLKGWAVDPSNPESIPSVDVFHGEMFLGSVAAEINRPRLREAGAPYGARGFEFVLPKDPSITPDALRVRIARTRIDLRRSRSYPSGAMDDSGAGPVPKLPTGGLSQPALVAGRVTRPAADRVAFVVCCETADIAVTLASIRAQVAGQTSIALIGSSHDGARSFGSGQDEAFAAFLREARHVVFVAAGDEMRPNLSRRLIEASPGADVHHWRVAGRRDLGPAPDLALALGASSGGLALRSEALASGVLPSVAAIERQGLRAVELSLAGTRLGWAMLDGTLSEARPASASAATPLVPQRPRRISLAVWSGWSSGPPVALKALLRGAAGFDVEVLAPASAAGGLEPQLASWAGSETASLHLRIVDLAGDPDDQDQWRAMALAATGQVVILSEGWAEPPPEALPELAAWAALPTAGTATLPFRDGDQTLAGLTLERGADGSSIAASAYDEALAGLDRPILAAPAGFMALSRAAAAEVGGLQSWSAASPADVHFGMDLQATGRRSVLLGRFSASAPSGTLARWMRRPFSGPAPALAEAYLTQRV